MPDAGLMQPCTKVAIPAGKLTDNQVGILLLDYDSALDECEYRRAKLQQFITSP